MRIRQMWHVCLVVRDVERSVAFYRDVLGMDVIKDVYTRETPLMSGISYGTQSSGVASDSLVIKCAFVGPPGLGGDPDQGTTSPFLDLVEFVQPASEGEPYPSLHHVGLTRVAFTVDDVHAALAELRAQGIEPVAPLVELDGLEPGLSGKSYFCILDPDGIVVEFYGPVQDIFRG